MTCRAPLVRGSILLRRPGRSSPTDRKETARGQYYAQDRLEDPGEGYIEPGRNHGDRSSASTWCRDDSECARRSPGQDAVMPAHNDCRPGGINPLEESTVSR